GAAAAAPGAPHQTRPHPPQRSRHDRLRLPRRADDPDDQPRDRAGGGDARHADRTARVPARRAGRARRGRGAAGERAGRGRVRKHGGMTWSMAWNSCNGRRGVLGPRMDWIADGLQPNIEFYESDWLGRTSRSLIAGRSRPEQSAPTACEMRPRGCPGSVAQSASASFSSLELPIRLDDVPARRSRARKPWFYLRLGTEPA